MRSALAGEGGGLNVSQANARPPVALCPAGERLAAAEEVLDGSYAALEAIVKGARYLPRRLQDDLLEVLVGLEQVQRDLDEAQLVLSKGNANG